MAGSNSAKAALQSSFHLYGAWPKFAVEPIRKLRSDARLSVTCAPSVISEP